MDEDDDLDAELALFESQIQRVKAATKAPEPPPRPLPKPLSKPAQSPRPATTQAPPTKPIQQQTHPQPPLAQHSTAAHPVTPKPGTQSTGRWHWDGATWRWRTTPAVATKTTSPESQQASTPASSTPGPARPSAKRTAAGEVWSDPTLVEWPQDDHRIFVGDLAPDATEKHLSDAFGVYPSFAMAKVVRDKRSGACKGYGFVSFLDGRDMVRALRELNGKYVGGRPVKLKRSNWQKRSLKGEKWKELKALQKIAKR